MNNVERIQPLINFIFPFVLLLTIYIVYRFIVSLLPKQVEVDDIKLFKKGKTEFLDPPRPNSPKFDYFFNHSMMETFNQRYELVKLTSEMVKDIFKLKNTQLNSNMSQNLELFVNDVDSWFQQKYKNLEAQNRLNNRKYTKKFFYEEFKLILNEIGNLLLLPLFRKED